MGNFNLSLIQTVVLMLIVIMVIALFYCQIFLPLGYFFASAKTFQNLRSLNLSPLKQTKRLYQDFPLRKALKPLWIFLITSLNTILMAWIQNQLCKRKIKIFGWGKSTLRVLRSLPLKVF